MLAETETLVSTVQNQINAHCTYFHTILYHIIHSLYFSLYCIFSLYWTTARLIKSQLKVFHITDLRRGAECYSRTDLTPQCTQEQFKLHMKHRISMKIYVSKICKSRECYEVIRYVINLKDLRGDLTYKLLHSINYLYPLGAGSD